MKKGFLLVVVLVCVAFCITLAGCGKTAAVTTDPMPESAAVIAESRLAGNTTTAQKLCDMLGTTLRSAVDISGNIAVSGAELDVSAEGEIFARLGELSQTSDNPLSLILDRSLSADLALDFFSADTPSNLEVSRSINIFLHDGSYYMGLAEDQPNGDYSLVDYAAEAGDAYPQALKEIYDFYKQKLPDLLGGSDYVSYYLYVFPLLDILCGASIGDTIAFYTYIDGGFADYWQTIANTLDIGYDSTIADLVASDLFTLTDDGSAITLVINNEVLITLLDNISNGDYPSEILDQITSNLFVGLSFNYAQGIITGLDIQYYMQHAELPGEYYTYFQAELNIQALSPAYEFEAPAAAQQMFDNIETAGLQEDYTEAVIAATSKEPFFVSNFTLASDQAVTNYALDQISRGDLEICLLGVSAKSQTLQADSGYQENMYFAFTQPDTGELYNLFGAHYSNPRLTVGYDGFNRLSVSLSAEYGLSSIFSCYWRLDKNERFTLNNDGTYTLAECIADVDQYTIPSEYEGTAITAIAADAFDCANIGTLTIPASIKSVPRLMSRRSSQYSIDNIILENGIKTIEDNAFMSTEITSITIPASVTSVGRRIANNYVIADFEDESGANYYYDGNILYTTDKTEILGVYGASTIPSSIVLPKELISVGSYMFYCVDELTSVGFEEGSALESIESFAFCDTGITEITVPASVTSLGTWFVDYGNVNIIIEESNTTYFTLDNILYSDNKSRIVSPFDIYNMPAEVTLPKELVAIPDYLFRSLPSRYIGNGPIPPPRIPPLPTMIIRLRV